MWFLFSEKKPFEVPYLELNSQHILSWNEEGMITLQTATKGDVVQTLDLQTFIVEYPELETPIHRPTNEVVATERAEEVAEPLIAPSVEPTLVTVDEQETIAEEPVLLSENIDETTVFRGYTVKVHTVVDGETVWDLQQALVPEKNVWALLPDVQDLNNGKDLHWIYPGETIYLLSSEIAPPPVVEPTPEPEPIPEPIPEPALSTFIFTRGSDEKSVYAFHPTTHVLIQVSVDNKEAKLKTDVLGVFNLPQAISIIENDKIIVAQSVNGDLYVTKTMDETFVKVINPSVPITRYTVDSDYVYLVQNDYLYRDDMHMKTSSFVGEPIYLGEIVSGISSDDTHIYAHTPFGANLDKGVLLQINKENWNVDNLVELITNDNRLLGYRVQEGVLYVAQVLKEKDLEENEILRPVVLPIETKHLTKRAYLKDLQPGMKSMVLGSQLYDWVENDLIFYSTKKSKELGRITLPEQTDGYFPMIRQ